MLAELRSEDARVRRRALISLEAGEAPIDDEICQLLIELLGDPSKEVARRASGALARAATRAEHRGRIERALDDADPRRRWCAAFALAQAGIRDEAVTRSAVEALGAADGDVRWAAAEIVRDAVRTGPELLPLVTACLGSELAEQRKMALYCLRDLGADDAQPFIVALGDADRGVRLAALAGLARSRHLDGVAIGRIAACIRDDADVGVRRAAAATLADVAVHDAAAATALAEATNESGDEDLVRAATRRQRRREP